jgi:hypothetical protein
VYVHVSYDLHLSVHIHSTALQMYLAITTVSWTCGSYAVMVGGFKWQCILQVHARLRNNTVLPTLQAVYLSRSMTEVQTNWSQPIACQWYDENQHLYCCHPICEEWPMVLNIIKLVFHGLSVGYRTFHWTSGRQNIRYMKMEWPAFARGTEHTLG